MSDHPGKVDLAEWFAQQEGTLVEPPVAHAAYPAVAPLRVVPAGRRKKVLLVDDDLAVTDVVMPGGLDYGEVAEKARQIRPAIKVLFQSGYFEAPWCIRATSLRTTVCW